MVQGVKLFSFLYNQILIYDDFSFYAPTAFTPEDKLGLNNKFYVTGSGINNEDYLMIIYDRWGENVYETNLFNPLNHKENGWDGRIKKGDVGETGVYTWVVFCKDTVIALLYTETDANIR